MDFRRLATLIILAAPALAQNVASLSPPPRAQFFDASGRPLAGGCVASFQAGSTTPLTTYSNAAGTANPNPVQLDASGRADIWLQIGTAYKLTVRTATTGCLGLGTLLYTTDNIIDSGTALAQNAAQGTLAIALRASPVTGTGGGVGPGNAMLSATTTGFYVSVNGGPPALLTVGGSTGQVQYNNSGSFAGTSTMVWNNTSSVLTVSGSATSGYQGPAFSSTNTGTSVAFTTQGGTFTVTGAGNGSFQNLTVSNTFNSLATGTTAAVQQSSGLFVIDGNGNAFFQSVCALNGSPATGTCNGVTPVAGTIFGSGVTALTLGASITDTGTAYAITETDSGGGCNIGTAYTGGIGCSSDARLKEHVTPLPNALAGVNALKPVAFDWTKNHQHAIGFIAQDVQKVFPDVVRAEKDGFLSLSYPGLIPELVKSIQELTARVAVLEGRRGRR